MASPAPPTRGARAWVRWAPRVLAVAFTAFISLFAFDAFEGVEGTLERVIALSMHLIPTVVCAALIALSWRREWVGALGSIGLALLYAWSARAHLDWIGLISGPLVVLGILYALAWHERRRAQQRA